MVNGCAAEVLKARRAEEAQRKRAAALGIDVRDLRNPRNKKFVYYTPARDSDYFNRPPPWMKQKKTTNATEQDRALYLRTYHRRNDVQDTVAGVKQAALFDPNKYAVMKIFQGELDNVFYSTTSSTATSSPSSSPRSSCSEARVPPTFRHSETNNVKNVKSKEEVIVRRRNDSLTSHGTLSSVESEEVRQTEVPNSEILSSPTSTNSSGYDSIRTGSAKSSRVERRRKTSVDEGAVVVVHKAMVHVDSFGEAKSDGRSFQRDIDGEEEKVEMKSDRNRRTSLQNLNNSNVEESKSLLLMSNKLSKSISATNDSLAVSGRGFSHSPIKVNSAKLWFDIVQSLKMILTNSNNNSSSSSSKGKKLKSDVRSNSVSIDHYYSIGDEISSINTLDEVEEVLPLTHH